MVPGLAALGTIHHGNVYEDSTLDCMARRVLAGAFHAGRLLDGRLRFPRAHLMAPERVTGVAFIASSAHGYSQEETERRRSAPKHRLQSICLKPSQALQARL